MYKRSTSVAKGLCIGLAAGAAAAVIGSHCIKTNKKTLRKNAGRAFDAVNHFMDHIDCMLRK